MRKCKNCGVVLPDKESYCRMCGQETEPVVVKSETANKTVPSPSSFRSTGDNKEFAPLHQGNTDPNKNKKNLIASICIVGSIIIGIIILLAIAIHETAIDKEIEIERLISLKIQLIERKKERLRLQALAHEAELERRRQENAFRQNVLDQMIAILNNTKSRVSKENPSYEPEFWNDYIKLTRYFTTYYNNDSIPELWICHPGYLAECNGYEVFAMQSDGQVSRIANYCIDGYFSLKNGVVYAVASPCTDDCGWYVAKYTISGSQYEETIVQEGDYYEDAPDMPMVKKYYIYDLSHLKKSFKFLDL